MSLQSVLYVSSSTLRPDVADDAVREIVAVSRANNPVQGLTGALMFTGEYFAQVLEGPAPAVDRLMERIARDTRHGAITVIARQAISARRFSQWSMAYSGRSQFVTRYITRLLPDGLPAGKARSAEWLDQLIWEFAEGVGAA